MGFLVGFGGGGGFGGVIGAVVWGDEADEAGEAAPLGAEDVAEAVHGEGVVAAIALGLLGGKPCWVFGLAKSSAAPRLSRRQPAVGNTGGVAWT